MSRRHKYSRRLVKPYSTLRTSGVTASAAKPNRKYPNLSAAATGAPAEPEQAAAQDDFESIPESEPGTEATDAPLEVDSEVVGPEVETPVVSAKAPPRAQSVYPSAPDTSIPPEMLERLRAAQRSRGVNRSTSSLGRLLMSTSAGFSKNKEMSRMLMDDYLKRQQEDGDMEVDNVAQEQKLRNDEAIRRKNEAAAMEDEAKARAKIKDLEDGASTESDRAELARQVGRRLGFSEEAVAKFTGNTLDSLVKLMQSQNTLTGKVEPAKINSSTKLTIAQMTDKLKRLGYGVSIQNTNTRAQASRDVAGINADARVKSANISAGATRYAADAGATSRVKVAEIGKEGRQLDRENKQDVRDQKRFDDTKKHLSTKIKPNSIAQRELLKNLVDLASGKVVDLPGVGVIDGSKPNWLNSLTNEQAALLRQKAQNIYNPGIKEIAGVSVNPTEEERTSLASGKPQAFRSEAEFREGMKLFSNLYYSGLKNAYSTAPDKAAVREYIRETGQYIPGDNTYGSSGSLFVEPKARKVLVNPTTKEIAVEENGVRRVVSLNDLTPEEVSRVSRHIGGNN